MFSINVLRPASWLSWSRSRGGVSGARVAGAPRGGGQGAGGVRPARGGGCAFKRPAPAPRLSRCSLCCQRSPR